MVRTIQKAWRRTIMAGMVLAIAISAIAVFAPAASLSALPACREVATGATTLSPDGYYYSPQYTVPSTSTCNDINLRNVVVAGSTLYSGYFRVRFYPTSGGSYTNNWHYFDPPTNAGQDFVVATSVLNGTKYRIESQYGSATFTLKD